MPSEVRVLIFSNHEVAQALTEFGTADETGLPAGEIVGIRGGDQIINIDVRENDGCDTLFQVSPVRVATSLFGLCKKVGVPLPRKSKKTLEFVGDQVAIRVRMKPEQKKPEAIYLDC